MGTFEECASAERRCDIPNNVAIMFPAIVSEKSFVEYPQLRTEDDLSKMASEANERVKDAYVEIDGLRPNINEFRIRIPSFRFIFS